MYVASLKFVKGKVLAQCLGQISNFRVLGQKLFKKALIRYYCSYPVEMLFSYRHSLIISVKFLD